MCRSYVEAMLTFLDGENVAINNKQSLVAYLGRRYLTLLDLPCTETNVSPKHESSPEGVKQLSLGCIINARVDWVALPSSLERLSRGGDLNKSIESVAWPVPLTHLTLRGSFDQSNGDVVWPVER